MGFISSYVTKEKLAMKLSWVLFVFMFVSGCATTSKDYIESKELNVGNSASVNIYRTDVAYHSLNPEKPFFYVDDMYIGKLGTGGIISIKLTPGEHILTSRESILFMPGGESGRVKGMFSAGEEYYFRYSKEFSSVVPTGTGFYMSDSTTLQPANEAGYNEKK